MKTFRIKVISPGYKLFIATWGIFLYLSFLYKTDIFWTIYFIGALATFVMGLLDLFFNPSPKAQEKVKHSLLMGMGEYAEQYGAAAAGPALFFGAGIMGLIWPLFALFIFINGGRSFVDWSRGVK